MNRDDIIRMAREAGFSEAWLSAGENPPHFEAPAVMVERFAALVAAAEREACLARADIALLGATILLRDRVLKAIHAKGQQ